MRGALRHPWPLLGAVVAVTAVVGVVVALATPDEGPSARDVLGASATASPTVEPAGPQAPSGTPEGPASPDPATPPVGEPAPGGGPVADYVELPPVALDAPAEYGTGVVGRVVGIEAVDAQAHGVGEISGPGVAVTVELTAGAEGLDLGDVVVNLYGPSGAASPVVTGDPRHRPFTGALDPGERARATYVLRPTDMDAPARITVAYSGAVPAATFEGALP